MIPSGVLHRETGRVGHVPSMAWIHPEPSMTLGDPTNLLSLHLGV